MIYFTTTIVWLDSECIKTITKFITNVKHKVKPIVIADKKARILFEKHINHIYGYDISDIKIIKCNTTKLETGLLSESTIN